MNTTCKHPVCPATVSDHGICKCTLERIKDTSVESEPVDEKYCDCKRGTCEGREHSRCVYRYIESQPLYPIEKAVEMVAGHPELTVMHDSETEWYPATTEEVIKLIKGEG